MRVPAILHFFLIAVLAIYAVWKAHGLQAKYRQPYLPTYTFFLASWGALVLLSVMQFILAGVFLPGSAMAPMLLAATPMVAVAMASAFYLLLSFFAQLAGSELSKTLKIIYLSAWALVAALVLAVTGAAPSLQTGIPRAVSAAFFVLKTASMYGSVVFLLLRLRSIDDPLRRTALRDFALMYLAGFLLFDLSVRFPCPEALHDARDYFVSALQIGINYPPLLFLSRSLRRQALLRPPAQPSIDLKTVLAPYGVSPREAEIVDLMGKGYSNKEIAERLSISVDTVKKHGYNVYRKLGVQNRVQLSYFVQNLNEPRLGAAAATARRGR